MACITKVQVLMFDEPSSYLDIKQRLVGARVIFNKKFLVAFIFL